MVRKQTSIAEPDYFIVLGALYHKLRKLRSVSERKEAEHFQMIKEHFESKHSLYEDEQNDVAMVLQEFMDDMNQERIRGLIQELKD